jgi:Fe2+ transport system protein FeoA
MANSESPTRVSEAAAGLGRERLVDAVAGRRLRIVAVDPEHRAVLLAEGLDAGVEVAVERRLALGGPLIVQVGRARLAVSRSVAAGVEVEPAC